MPRPKILRIHHGTEDKTQPCGPSAPAWTLLFPRQLVASASSKQPFSNPSLHPTPISFLQAWSLIRIFFCLFTVPVPHTINSVTTGAVGGLLASDSPAPGAEGARLIAVDK